MYWDIYLKIITGVSGSDITRPAVTGEKCTAGVSVQTG